MPQQLAPRFGRQTFAFDKGVVGQGSTQGLAPVNTFLHSLAGGGNSHGVEPAAVFWAGALNPKPCR